MARVIDSDARQCAVVGRPNACAVSVALLSSGTEYVAFAGSVPRVPPPLAMILMWSAQRVLGGQADFLVSDHAPWLTSEKERGSEDIWEAPNGLVSLQSANVVTLTEGTGRGLSLPQFVRLSSSNVARWLGLYPKKGALQPGSDADLAVYARGVRDVVRSSRLLCKQRWTPYEGRRVDFRLEACMLRGAWVYKDATIQTGPIGEFISCASATAS